MSPSLDFHAPARLVVDRQGEWALALPATRPSRTVERLLAMAGVATGAAGEGLALASAPELLPSLSGAVQADEGAVRGGDLAALARRLAGSDALLVVAGVEPRDLRRAAGLLDGVRAARWRLTPAGGRILLEW